MKITRTNINFNGGLNAQHIRFIRDLNPSEAALRLKQKFNIDADFADSKVVAGLCTKAVDVFDSLNQKLPTGFRVFEFKNMGEGMPNEMTTAYTAFSDCWTKMLGVINFNTSFWGKNTNDLMSFDLYCNSLKENFATDHILQIIFHEFMHSNLFQTLNGKINSSTIADLKKINFMNFWDEISSKAGYYALDNPLEFQANYWAREVCDSLDENWQPKYNPFKNPQIKLSPNLRKFLTAVENADTSKARKIARNESFFPLFKWY